MNNEFICTLIKDKTFKNVVSAKYVVNKETYLVKVGKGTYCCSLTSDELKSDDIILCFNGDKSYFYIIDKTYKDKINDPDAFVFLGEYKSQHKGAQEPCDFGFGHKAAGLTKYKVTEFIKKKKEAN